MADEKKMELATRVYQTMCKAIESRELSFEKDDEKLIVHFGVNGDSVPMQFFLIVDAERQLISVMSPLPFKMSESKRMEGAIATCVASFGLPDGSFDYDFSDGSITLRVTESFRASVIGEGLFVYLISCSFALMEEYLDRFLALDKGDISITDFIAKEY